MLSKAKPLAALMAALLLTGCITYSLEELRRTTPRGTPFQNALASLYLDFASVEEKEYDWFTSMHFADKGLMSAYGKDTQPEDLKEWHLPAEALPQMEKARAELIAVLMPDTVKQYPELAAKAQFYFDCWVEQQEENWQEEDIAYCRENLASALAQLHASVELAQQLAEEEAQHESRAEAKKSAVHKEPVAAMKAAPVLKEAMKTPETLSYIVVFDPKQAALSEGGKKVVDDVVATLKDMNDYSVIISGYADPAAIVKYDNAVAAARIDSIKARLVEGGVKDNAITTYAYGKPKDGQKPAAARQVEIYVSE